MSKLFKFFDSKGHLSRCTFSGTLKGNRESLQAKTTTVHSYTHIYGLNTGSPNTVKHLPVQ